MLLSSFKKYRRVYQGNRKRPLIHEFKKICLIRKPTGYNSSQESSLRVSILWSFISLYAFYSTFIHLSVVKVNTLILVLLLNTQYLNWQASVNWIIQRLPAIDLKKTCIYWLWNTVHWILASCEENEPKRA